MSNICFIINITDSEQNLLAKGVKNCSNMSRKMSVKPVSIPTGRNYRKYERYMSGGRVETRVGIFNSRISFSKIKI